MKLAFVGFGTVATRFAALLDAQRQHLATRYGLRYRIVGIATGHHGAAINPNGIDAARATEAAAARSLCDLHALEIGPPPTDTPTFLDQVTTTVGHDSLVVVENTPLGFDGSAPGVEHVRRALTASANVITANKGPAAFAFRELRDLATRVDRCFLFEGAVLDGLPVFSLFRQTLPALRVGSFRGVVNTTTNHVLTAMESGLSFEEAIREMQAAGLTETDPSKDIDGWDAAAKTAVLANVLMDADLTPHDVRRQGLGDVSLDDIKRARAEGAHVKLVASATRTQDSVVACVEPVALPTHDPLANLNGTAKGLQLDTDLLGHIYLSKSASGVAHTAYALLADLIEVHRQHATPKERGDRRQLLSPEYL